MFIFCFLLCFACWFLLSWLSVLFCFFIVCACACMLLLPRWQPALAVVSQIAEESLAKAWPCHLYSLPWRESRAPQIWAQVLTLTDTFPVITDLGGIQGEMFCHWLNAGKKKQELRFRRAASCCLFRVFFVKLVAVSSCSTVEWKCASLLSVSACCVCSRPLLLPPSLV